MNVMSSKFACLVLENVFMFSGILYWNKVNCACCV